MREGIVYFFRWTRGELRITVGALPRAQGMFCRASLEKLCQIFYRRSYFFSENIGTWAVLNKKKGLRLLWRSPSKHPLSDMIHNLLTLWFQYNREAPQFFSYIFLVWIRGAWIVSGRAGNRDSLFRGSGCELDVGNDWLWSSWRWRRCSTDGG